MKRPANMDHEAAPTNHDHERSMLEVIQALRDRGYKEDLSAEALGIRASKSDVLYKASDLKINLVERFEGMSNPSDSSELFAISGPNGFKGILISAYGAKHSQEAEQIRQLSWGKTNPNATTQT